MVMMNARRSASNCKERSEKVKTRLELNKINKSEASEASEPTQMEKNLKLAENSKFKNVTNLKLFKKKILVTIKPNDIFVQNYSKRRMLSNHYLQSVFPAT